MSGQIIDVIAARSLDQLWQEAERLGRIEVDRELFADSGYRVRIHFKRQSGTRVAAEGKDENIAYAMSKAISEARHLSAGDAR